MTADAAPATVRVLAWLAVVFAVALIVLGAVWYGLSTEVHHRIWRDILDRPGGPMTFRFILQPCMAAVAALHDGLQDARLGRTPYFWTVLHDPAVRGDRLREGLFSTARIILLGLGMDAIYQYRFLNTFFPGESVLIALLLAFVPYVVLRGPIARIARWWRSRPHRHSADGSKC
jgi:hypothetical protein